MLESQWKKYVKEVFFPLKKGEKMKLLWRIEKWAVQNVLSFFRWTNEARARKKSDSIVSLD